MKIKDVDLGPRDFKFISAAGEEVMYSEVVSGKFKVRCKEDEMTIARLGGIGWEYDAYTEEHLGPAGRTVETEYLLDPKKVVGTVETFSFYELKFGKLNKGSKVIEFGCNLARNLRYCCKKYESCCVGIDISHQAIEKNKEYFGDGGEFYQANLRDGGEFLKRFKDNEFDLGITSGFLMHIAANKDKQKLINEILRICKTCWFSECYNDKYLDLEYTEGGGATCGEHLGTYDKRIKMIPRSDYGRDRPNDHALYMFSCE